MEEKVVLEKKAVDNAIILLQEAIFPNTPVKVINSVLQQLSMAQKLSPVTPVPLQRLEKEGE